MNQTYHIAVAIIFGFTLVAGAILLSGGLPSLVKSTNAEAVSPMRTENNRVYGNADASVRIVEFSDMECPFCSRVHPTIKRIVDESENTIVWEYRHLPLASHRSAEYAALVSECVGDLLGDDMFWNYLDEIFANQSLVSQSYLEDIAVQLGISESDLTTCTEDPVLKERIAKDVSDAQAFGGSGTPYSLVIFPDGTVRPVSGALPYEQWKDVVSQ